MFDCGLSLFLFICNNFNSFFHFKRGSVAHPPQRHTSNSSSGISYRSASLRRPKLPVEVSHVGRSAPAYEQAGRGAVYLHAELGPLRSLEGSYETRKPRLVSPTAPRPARRHRTHSSISVSLVFRTDLGHGLGTRVGNGRDIPKVAVISAVIGHQPRSYKLGASCHALTS